MLYVKDNVERYVGNIVDAKKLEADGYKLVDEPFKKWQRFPMNEPEEPIAETVAPTVHRGRRRKES